MTKTNVAYVSIERLKVTKTQEGGTMTGLPREAGGTDEWHMKMTVNGQVQGGTRTASRRAGIIRSV